MKKNIIGAFLIFSVTIVILLLLNTFSEPNNEKKKDELASEKTVGKKDQDIATH